MRTILIASQGGTPMPITTDYDAPRTTVTTDDSLEDLKARRNAPEMAAIDADENDLAADYLLPGTDLLDEELTVTVVPMKADEFRCTRCYLVWHRSQQATGREHCRDCS
jgi:Domain of unknown function (DUF4193)